MRYKTEIITIIMKITATIIIIILMTVLKSKLSEETVKFHKD